MRRASGAPEDPSGQRKKHNMNLKTCFAATGSAFVGLALAGAQPVETRPTGAAVERGAANDAFARIASGNGVTLKVSRRPEIWITTDGSNWVQHSSGGQCSLHDVAYGNGLFVAVGNEGSLVTSPDGVCWTTQNSRTDERLRGIVFGGGTFVVVGYAGTVITSKDGVRWKIRNSGTDERLQMVAYDRSTFVAIGWKGVLLTSANGTRWTTRSSGGSGRLDGITCQAGLPASRAGEARSLSGRFPLKLTPHGNSNVLSLPAVSPGLAAYSGTSFNGPRGGATNEVQFTNGQFQVTTPRRTGKLKRFRLQGN
jgi:hypothetical protein